MAVVFVTIAVIGNPVQAGKKKGIQKEAKKQQKKCAKKFEGQNDKHQQRLMQIIEKGGRSQFNRAFKKYEKKVKASVDAYDECSDPVEIAENNGGSANEIKAMQVVEDGEDGVNDWFIKCMREQAQKYLKENKKKGKKAKNKNRQAKQLKKNTDKCSDDMLKKLKDLLD